MNPALQQVADNAGDLLCELRRQLIAGGFSEAEAAEVVKVWYPAWSEYLSALVSANVAAAGGVAAAIAGHA